MLRKLRGPESPAPVPSDLYSPLVPPYFCAYIVFEISTKVNFCLGLPGIRQWTDTPAQDFRGSIRERQRRKVCAACQQILQRYDAVDIPACRMGVECAVLFHAPHGAVLGVVSGQHAAALSIQNPDVLHILALYIALLCQLCLDAVAAEILVGRVVSRAVSVFIAAALVHPHQPAIGKAGQGVVALPPLRELWESRLPRG